MNATITLSPEQTPPYFYQLSIKDQLYYIYLQQSFKVLAETTQRNQRMIQFLMILNKIRLYSNQGDNDDIKRSLVCGVIWLKEGIAVNTAVLGTLIGKCKSSINATLSLTRFNEFLDRSKTRNILLSLVPTLFENKWELRKWSIRRYSIPNSVENSNDKNKKLESNTEPQIDPFEKMLSIIEIEPFDDFWKFSESQ